ncbi:hypothetical protein D4764_17G0006770 [Takifugu flavidus]|uniref:Uncharacterized protein n=1 Tax=Takifugu flavidus TaxID=433684 RepID=A0A5C6NUL9_9TELE|nr:hypothetical protein D4764_17G0006770 [Takifugu flavidus]
MRGEERRGEERRGEERRGEERHDPAGVTGRAHDWAKVHPWMSCQFIARPSMSILGFSTCHGPDENPDATPEFG